MQVLHARWERGTGWTGDALQAAEKAAGSDLVLVFAAPELFRDPEWLGELRRGTPGAYLCGCSTAGEIAGDQVLDGSASAAFIKFANTTVRAAHVTVDHPADSFAAGQRLASLIPHEGLAHAIVLSDGLAVNGSQLASGLTSTLPPSVALTGGLAGDGARFGETYICADGIAMQRAVVLVGLYGSDLTVGYGSMGGWDPFGPERRVTRSSGNVLFELDGQSALNLYKQYLGHHAESLPASGLLFPLTIRNEDSAETFTRTLLSVNEQAQSMTFAGDVPTGAIARLMRANFDRLIEGASSAAHACGSEQRAELAILVSCVGRKLVLKQRVEEEVEAVAQVLGSQAVITGFYSYGEIAPSMRDARSALHNQTMTITAISEG